MLNLLKSLAYPLGSFPKGAYDAFIISLLPLYLASFTQNTTLIGAIVTISALENAIISLFIGPLTDSAYSRIGRRKIYILTSIVITSILLLVYPLFHNLTSIIVLVILSGFSASIISAPHLALITSNSEKSKRAQVTALIGIFYLLGQITITVLALLFWKDKIDSSLFLTVALFFTIPAVPLLIWSKDEEKPNSITQKFDARNILEFFRDSNRNVYLISQLILWFGINSVLPFFTLFVKSYLQLPQQNALLFYLIIVLSSGIFAFPFAILGRKIKEIRAFQIGLVFLFLAGIVGIFAKDLPLIIQYLVALFAGIGNASTSVFSYSIFTKLVPEDKIGIASGIHTAVISGIAPIAASISGFFIGIYGFQSMFVSVAITTIFCIFLLNRTTHAD